MKRKIPEFSLEQIKPKSKKYCIGIPVINEGEKFKKQLRKMYDHGLYQVADILIFDGGSSDSSVAIDFLRENEVTALLVKKSAGKQGTQLRMGFSYCLDQGYEGIVTIDGNNKDSTEDIVTFIKKLEEGYDFIQGSRYIPGGKAINTPLSRHLAVKFVHSPWISFLAGFRFTDTTNGFRGISKKVLLDENLNIFREIFISYELLFYMSTKVPRLGYQCLELPVTRSYPAQGKIPSKISFWGNFKIIFTLIALTFNKFGA